VYLALVHGDATAQAIDLPIGPDPRRLGHSRLDHRHGQPARSTIRVRESFYGYTLLEVEIETGRLHQVRVHLQAIGHPLVGDAAYGGGPLLLSKLKRDYKAKDDEAERPLLARPALHAGSLTLADPPVTITAPLPKDFAVTLKHLRKFAAR
jgi:23S rRNA-/tRNA-specific pseudouridylate synthase